MGCRALLRSWRRPPEYRCAVAGWSLSDGSSAPLLAPRRCWRHGTRRGLRDWLLAPFGTPAPGASPRSVGDVLQEDRAEDDVLVLGRVHVVTQSVGSGPHLRLEAKRASIRRLLHVPGAYSARLLPSSHPFRT